MPEQLPSYALVAGIGRRPQDAPGMAVSATDAYYLSKALYNYVELPVENITLLQDIHATRAGIEQGLQKLVSATQLQAAHTVYIYFSGHGVRLGADKALFLVPHDAVNEQLLHQAIPGTWLMSQLSQLNARQVLVWLDCCHAGAFNYADKQAAPIPFDEAAFCNQPNRVIITASNSAERYRLSQPVSLFTYALIEGLAGQAIGPDGQKNLTLFDLAMYVRERVSQLSACLGYHPAQKPELHLLKQLGATQNFVLCRDARGLQKQTPFDQPIEKLTNEKGIAVDISNQPAPQPDDDYRKQWGLYFNNNQQVNQQTAQKASNQQSQGHNNNLLNDSTLQQAKAITNNYGLTPNQVIELFELFSRVQLKKQDTDEEVKPELFTTIEKEVLLADRDEDIYLGIFHIKHNNYVLLQIPLEQESYEYALSTEGFSQRIIRLLQKVAVEGVLDNEEYDLLGMALYNRLLPADKNMRANILDNFIKISQRKDSRKFRFQFQFDQQSLEMAAIPWEYLYVNAPHQPGFFLGEKFIITRKHSSHQSSSVTNYTAETLKVLWIFPNSLYQTQVLESIQQALMKFCNANAPHVEMEFAFVAMIEQANEQEIDNKTMRYLHMKFDLVHLVGIGRTEPPMISGKYQFGFPDKEAGELNCQQWHDAGQLLDALKTVSPTFLFLHNIPFEKGNSLGIHPQQSFEATTHIAFQCAGLIPGVVALQTPLDALYSPAFLEQFYETLIRGTPVHEAVQQAISYVQNAYKGNRLIGLASVFANRQCRIQLQAYASAQPGMGAGSAPAVPKPKFAPVRLGGSGASTKPDDAVAPANSFTTGNNPANFAPAPASTDKQKSNKDVAGGMSSTDLRTQTNTNL